MRLTPYRFRPTEEAGAVLALIRAAFGYMDGRIDPPSSMHQLTEVDIVAQAEIGEVWVISDCDRLVACAFLTPKPDYLYLGKLAVAGTHRGQGLARRLVETAETSARARGLSVLELQTRVELVENHAAFARLGFVKTGETAHAGHDRPTSYSWRKTLA